MRLFLISLGLVVAAAIGSPDVVATQSVDETKIVESDGKVLISNPRGEIRVYGWDKPEVRVKGDLDDRTEAFTFEVDGYVTEIRVKIPENTHFGNGSDLEIHVPIQSKVKFNGISTDLEISGIEGGVDIGTVSGEVAAEAIIKRLSINTVSGNVQVSQNTGRMKVVSVSGSLDLASKAIEVSLSTVSGDVNVGLGDFESLDLSTVSGEVDVSGDLKKSGHISMNSVSGDIELRLDQPVDARISVKTGPGGDIVNQFTDDDPEEIFPAQMTLQTTSGRGLGRIKINTVTGDVRLK